jgi:hypothetical protein
MDVKNSNSSSKSEMGGKSDDVFYEEISPSNLISINGLKFLIDSEKLKLRMDKNSSDRKISGEEVFEIDGEEFSKQEKQLYNQLEGMKKFSDASSISVKDVKKSLKKIRMRNIYNNFLREHSDGMSNQVYSIVLKYSSSLFEIEQKYLKWKLKARRKYHKAHKEHFSSMTDELFPENETRVYGSRQKNDYKQQDQRIVFKKGKSTIEYQRALMEEDKKIISDFAGWFELDKYWDANDEY